MRPFILGLAGGIGAGKSLVARLLAAHGAVVSDSDAHARAALALDDVRAAMVARWGRSVLDASGRVDRSVVARIVFADASERAWLEGLIHPRIAVMREEELASARAKRARVFVIDAPLLFEAGLDAACDAVIFVDAPREARVKRVATRGWNEAELSRREAAQWPLERKKARCRFVIENGGDEAATRRDVERVWESLVPRG